MKSIIFNTEMVKAILDGRKAQFRIALGNRFIISEYQPEDINGDDSIYKYRIVELRDNNKYDTVSLDFFSSYGFSKYKAYDILYVKETFALVNGGQYIFKADDNEKKYESVDLNIKWNSAVHLTQGDARIFLKVTNVRVERLQDISLEDMLKEGINHKKSYNYGDIVKTSTQIKREFINSWNSKAKDGCKWEDNPYVFVYEFERINKED